MTLKTGPVGTQDPSKTTNASRSRWRQPPPTPLLLAAGASVVAAMGLGLTQGADLFTPQGNETKGSSTSPSPTPGPSPQPRPERRADAQLVPSEPLPRSTPSAPEGRAPQAPPPAPSPESQAPKGEIPHGDMPANVRSQQVRPGDTLSKVSRELCTKVDDLALLNHLRPNAKLQAGDWLAIPAPPKHASAVEELLTTVANGATDDVAGMLTFELPGYEVTRDPREPFAWQARKGELGIRVLIRDACVSFTDTRTGTGGSAMVQGPSANQGTGPEDLSAAVRRAHQAFNAVQSLAPRS